MAKWSLPMVEGDCYAFTELTDEGLEYIAANLRACDREELHASVGHRRYADALRVSVAHSASAVMAVNAYGEPVAVLGVSTLSVLYNTGCPWMMATPQANRHKRAFIKAARVYTEAMLKEYARLENHVDTRNAESVAWLQHLGFKVESPEPYGPFGLLFHPFSLERSYV